MSEDNSQDLNSGGGRKTSTSEETAGEPQISPSTEEKASEPLQNDFVISKETSDIFEWIETKIELLKVLNSHEKIDIPTTEKACTPKDTNATLEEIMEDIHKITSKDSTESTSCISEEVNKMLDMLQETTMGLMDNLNPSEKRCRNIKVLATLIQHLSASVGTKVTLEETQRHINGKRVMELLTNLQDLREPVIMKMVTAHKYIGHGIRRARNVAKKCKRHRYEVDALFSEFSTSANPKIANDKLKAVARESENLLIKYSDSIGYLATKTKNFFSLKQETEKLLSSFMLKEIPDLYKT